jgi:hypothetical protein
MPDDYFRLEWLQYLTGSPLLSLLALLVVGAIYFLAPAVGYTTYNRGLLLGAVWVLIAKMGLVIFKIGIALIEEMDKGSSSSSSAFPPGSGSGSGPSKYSAAGPVMALIFFMLDSGLFVLALALFAGGLASLRREADARPLGSRPFPPPPRDRD